LVAGHLVAWAVSSRQADDSGANIGLGLLVFGGAALAVIPLAFRDGRHLRSEDAYTTWLAVCALFALTLSASIMVVARIAGEDFDIAVFFMDLVMLTPFIFTLTAVPAMLAVVIGRSTVRRVS
jgi:hypothetical protein